ncbi:MAG: hypothetical protein NZT92_07590 [Abditibacteriales bacterium]|nr:hypothetical protein [Abditibacteriales bacterium]MDW8365813.1 hypothetical protein [Abditibacteriales bacterium]
MLRSPYFHDKHPQRGQVLLLAVVLMLLIALVGAGFIAIISANIAQSESLEDRATAEKAAMEGIQYANDQLVNHPLGADWRPDVSLPVNTPLVEPWDPDDVETLHGWTQNYPNLEDRFFKSATVNTDKGYFLLRVRSAAFDPANPMTRYIEITSVGRTLNNPSVFKVLKAYKPVGLTDYAIHVTQYNAASDGFKHNVTALGKPPAIDYDADAVLQHPANAGATRLTISNPEVFSGDNPATPGQDGDFILIGRDPNPTGAVLLASNLFKNTVGIREMVQVESVDVTNHTIELVGGTTYFHEAGEPIVVGRINNNVFERKVTIGRLVRAVDPADNRLLVNTLQVRPIPPTKLQSGWEVFVGVNHNTAVPPTVRDRIVVTNVVDNETAVPPQPSEIQFDSVTTPLTRRHEKGTPVWTFVPSNTAVSPYESLAAAPPIERALPLIQEAEWSGSIVRGPIFSNSHLRFFGNLLLVDTLTQPARVDVAGTISYDDESNTDGDPLPARPDSTGAAIGHPSDTAINVLTNRVLLSGNDLRSADGVGRLTGDTTQPNRWVRPQRPPVFAQEGLFTSNYVGPNPFGAAASVANSFRIRRYEELTRHSDPTRLGNSPTLGELGFGRGIYIDNFEDVQFANAFLGDPPLLRFHKRRQALIDQWLYKPISDWTYLPNGYTDPAKDSDGRPQWVNPNSDPASPNVFRSLEYIPKGVQIILRNDDVVWDGTQFVSLGTANFHPTGAPHTPGQPVIWVIRSDKQPLGIDRSGASPAIAPVPLWTTDARVQVGGNALPLYFMSFDYPENGVILAAGNVRIQGMLPPSVPGGREYNLTVVSGGTIYIEGNILTPKDYMGLPPGDPRNTHIALLAKDHVALNTTQFYAPFAVGRVPTLTSPAPPIPPLLSFLPASLAISPLQQLDTAKVHSFWNIPARNVPPNVAPVIVARQFSLGDQYVGNVAVALRHGGRKKAALTVRYNEDPNFPVTDVTLTISNNATPPSLAPPYPYATPVDYTPTHLRADEPPNIGPDVCFRDPHMDGICGTADDDAPLTIGDVATLLQNYQNPTGQLQRYNGTTVDPSTIGAAAALLARLGLNESATAYLKQGGNLTPVDVPIIAQARLFVNSIEWWQVGNPNDPLALFEAFYVNPLLRPPVGAEPQIQPLMSQTVPATAPLFNAIGGLNEIQVTSETTGEGVLADYRLNRMKMEQYLSGVDPWGNPAFRPTWGLTIRVSALIYAQEGSWFVIPGPYFDESAYNDDTRAGRGDAVRYRRYNYRVIVNGAIVQNQTADDFPVMMGNRNVYTFDAAKWEERIAYPSFDPTLGAYVWNGIEYNWDPELKNARIATEDAMTGNVKPVLKLPKLPLGPDLIFIG